MTYKIIVDSCCDLNEEQKKDEHFQIISLTLQVDDTFVRDDENFNQRQFLKLVAESPNCPKTACPSPEDFKNAYNCDADMVFVVTLSKHLSGTFNSAMVGLDMYREKFGDEKKIAVFSSDSASCGETVQALKVQELAESGMSFDEIVKEMNDFIWNMKTFFVLESLDTLKKNGRLSGLQALFATALNIKPVMSADHGVIIKLDQARGISRALKKMCEYVAAQVINPENKILGIAHCNCPERAVQVRDMLLSLFKPKSVMIMNTAGVSTVYANDGGVIVAI